MGDGRLQQGACGQQGRPACKASIGSGALWNVMALQCENQDADEGAVLWEQSVSARCVVKFEHPLGRDRLKRNKTAGAG